MAGVVSEKFAPDVKVEVIYKGLLGIGIGGDGPKPPNVFVDDVELGKSFTQEELEQVVAQKIKKGVDSMIKIKIYSNNPPGKG